MPKIGFNIDSNYRKLASQAATLRERMKEHVHQPERRATSRPLFYTGFGALLIGLMVLCLR
jgi:hypothetical protein